MLVICGMDKTHNWHGMIKLDKACYVRTVDDVCENSNYVIKNPCTVEQVASLLEYNKEAVIASIVTPLSLQIASDLENGVHRDTSAISDEITKLLKLHARNRKRLLLVPYTSISSVAHIKELPGVLHVLTPSMQPPVPSAFYNALGICAIAQNKALQKLENKMFASACGVVQTSAESINVEEVVAEQRAVKQALADKNEESNALLSELRELRKQHEATIDKLETHLNEYKKATENNEQIILEKVEKLKSLKGENDLVLQQLHLAQEELEANSTKLKTVERELAESEISLKEFTAASGEKVKAVKEENIVILEQLFQVQSEIELKISEYKHLYEKHARLESTAEIQRADYETRLTQQRMQYEKETSELQGDLKRERKAVAELKESKLIAEKTNKSLAEQLVDLQKQHEAELVSKQKVLAMLTEELSNKNTSISEFSSDIRNLNRELKDVKASNQKQLKEQHQKHTLHDKQRSREIIKLEQQLSDKADEMHALRKELAELRAATQSPYWRLSRKLQRLGSLIDKAAPDREQMLLDISLLYTSELFDAGWYLNTYKDVAALEVDPAEHYLLYGAAEGRQPSQTFDGNWYLKRYPDVAESNANPLLHYIKHGREEGREVSPLMITHSK